MRSEIRNVFTSGRRSAVRVSTDIFRSREIVNKLCQKKKLSRLNDGALTFGDPIYFAHRKVTNDRNQEL